MLFNIGWSGFAGERGVNGNHCDGIAVFFGDLLKVGQFVYTGCAPCAPEVDDGHFAGFGGIQDFSGYTAAVYDFQLGSVAQIAYFRSQIRGGSGESFQ